MAKPTPLSSADDSTWRALLLAHDTMLEQIDATLESSVDLTLGEFEVLDFLAAAKGNQVRMNELATLTRLSPSGLTRRFDSLVRRGWVTRTKAAEDGRGILAGITSKGLAKVAEARPVHAQAVRTFCFDRLSAEQSHALGNIAERLATAD